MRVVSIWMNSRRLVVLRQSSYVWALLLLSSGVRDCLDIGSKTGRLCKVLLSSPANTQAKEEGKSWSRIATFSDFRRINVVKDGEIQGSKNSLYFRNSSFAPSSSYNSVKLRGHTIRVIMPKRCGQYDLSNPRQWMEYTMDGGDECSGDSGDVVHNVTNSGTGAYTVLRCEKLSNPTSALQSTESASDMSNKTPSSNGAFDSLRNTDLHWRICGEMFHMKRLQTSFDVLCRIQQTSKHLHAVPIDYHRAVDESQSIIQALLNNADFANYVTEDSSSPSIKPRKSGIAQKRSLAEGIDKVIMLTLFWKPKVTWCSSAGVSGIIVKGHACIVPISHPESMPLPITASIAMPRPNKSTCLPSRHDWFPSAKLTSWCRDRQPLEHPHKYKPAGVGEVLLVRRTWRENSSEDIELLEGLTSNLFVVYVDGTLRTSPDGVLCGYARHLVIRKAQSCGLTLDLRTPLLTDGLAGRWAEAFVTSSVRLVVPIDKIVLVEDGTAPFRDEICNVNEIWRQPEVSSLPWSSYKWHSVYRALLSED